MKNFAVVFTSNNARIVVNPSILQKLALKDKKNVVINPDLSLVKGVAPHFWKLSDDGKMVVEMTRPEKLVRLASHEAFGVDNNVEFPKKNLIKAILVGLGFIIVAASVTYCIIMLIGSQ